MARHIRERDARYFTTYYAIDTVNFDPVDLSSALDPLDAPYLPLVVLESAGVPLPSRTQRSMQDSGSSATI